MTEQKESRSFALKVNGIEMTMSYIGVHMIFWSSRKRMEPSPVGRRITSCKATRDNMAGMIGLIWRKTIASSRFPTFPRQ